MALRCREGIQLRIEDFCKLLGGTSKAKLKVLDEC